MGEGASKETTYEGKSPQLEWTWVTFNQILSLCASVFSSQLGSKLELVSVLKVVKITVEDMYTEFIVFDTW